MKKRERVSTSFVKGDPRINRKGAPKLSPIIKRIREIERHELTGKFSQLYNYNREKLKAVIDNPKSTMKEIIIASAIFTAAKSGEFSYIQPYIAYIFGLPKQPVEHSGEVNSKVEVNNKLNKLSISDLQKIAGMMKDDK